jgi:N-acetylneuraminic acid mutarotase
MKKAIGWLTLIMVMGLSGCSPKNNDNEPPPEESRPLAWHQVADFGGPAQRGSMSFTIGNAAYVVSGMGDSSIPHRQVWKYDPATNAWARMGDYPGIPVIEGVGFAIGSAGYVCLGNTNDSAGWIAECWQYNATADHWTRKGDFPGAPRSGCVAVMIGSKAYVFGGFSTSQVNERELWEYDAASDHWARKADCPGEGRFLPAAFAIGDKAYFGTGRIAGSGFVGSQDFWEYDPLADAWMRRADFPGSARGYALGAAVGGRGYVCFGILALNETFLTLAKDVWEYDPAGNAWTQRTDFAGAARAMASGFVLGSDMYFGIGNDANMVNLRDFWRARPGQ